MHTFGVMNDHNENVRILIVFVIIIPFPLYCNPINVTWTGDYNHKALPYYLRIFWAHTIIL